MNLIKRIENKIRWIKQKNNLKKDFENQFEVFANGNIRSFDLKFEDAKFYNERTSTTNFDAHYIYHPAWAARIVKKINPEFHIDISSTLHFCSQLSAFIPVRFYDYRPALLTLDQLTCERADLTNLHFETESFNSLSCMHTIEHIGLGRYGDPLDVNGDVKAINELKRVVKIGGNLLIVVPIGKPRIVFNAHRIYSPKMIIDEMQGFKLENFAFVNDKNDFFSNANLNDANEEDYGCGCFWFIKK